MSMTAGNGSTIINVSQDGQQPKRKGGRKPVSASAPLAFAASSLSRSPLFGQTTM